MKKIIITSLLAGLAVFAWEAFSWMALPWHMQTLNQVQDDKEVTEVLIKNTQTDKSKIYFLPSSEQCTEASPTAPHMFIAYVPQHHGFKENLLISLLSQIISALLICLLVSKTTNLKYLTKVALVTGIGIVIGINSYGACWNWWGFATDYSLVGLTDSIIAWFIGGLVIAKN